MSISIKFIDHLREIDRLLEEAGGHAIECEDQEELENVSPLDLLLHTVALIGADPLIRQLSNAKLVHLESILHETYVQVILQES